MQELFNKILDSLRDNVACVVATVVATQGSVPRQSGAKMVVFKDGSTDGTIGGGNLERRVIADALLALKKKKSLLKTYPLNKKAGLQVCGGKIFIFLDVLEPNKRLVICGAGHVGLALSYIAKLLNFDVWIVDNRRAFANRKRFPHVDRIMATPYPTAFRKMVLDINTSIVIVTHRHLNDNVCLELALKSKASYIGMMGSRTKIKEAFKALKNRGFKSHELRRVHAPIGLDIGAETPQEIAVAIAAQLIEVQRKSKIKKER